MSYTKWEYQNIVLAAMAQCAALVENLAVRGTADNELVAVCVNPLLNFKPDTVGEIYPHVSQLSFGMRTLQDMLGSEKQIRTTEIIRYLLGMLAIRQKLMSDGHMQEKLQSQLGELAPVQRDRDDFSDASDELFAEIAKIYQATISTYTFRIHVKGNMDYLKDDKIANKIRALLLAGVRASVLWYQIGGRRWHLVLYRKKINQTIGDIRKNLLSTA